MNLREDGRLPIWILAVFCHGHVFSERKGYVGGALSA